MTKRCPKSSLEGYRFFLKAHDMKPNTIDKYMRDVGKFLAFIRDGRLDHGAVARYREYLLANYKDTSANSMLAALNGYLKYIGRAECCVRLLKIQRRLFLDESRELTRREYERLVQQAESDGNLRMAHILQTIAGSGIRVGELAFITVESLGQQTVSINFKGKMRQILLPRSLVEKLENYCRRMGITAGSIFVTRSGRPVDRHNVWREMKQLCRKAGVEESKAFPHNLCHLFARCFYEKEKDMVRLADYLGHSSVETTRRYTVTSQMEDCRRTLEMGLVLEAEAAKNQSGWQCRDGEESLCARCVGNLVCVGCMDMRAGGPSGFRIPRACL